MVADPADYRFCTYGVWVQTGRHPFADAFRAHLLPALPVPLQTLDPHAVRCELRKAFARLAADGMKLDEAQTNATVAAAATAVALRWKVSAIWLVLGGAAAGWLAWYFS